MLKLDDIELLTQKQQNQVKKINIDEFKPLVKNEEDLLIQKTSTKKHIKKLNSRGKTNKRRTRNRKRELEVDPNVVENLKRIGYYCLIPTIIFAFASQVGLTLICLSISLFFILMAKSYEK